MGQMGRKYEIITSQIRINNIISLIRLHFAIENIILHIYPLSYLNRLR